MMHKSLLYIALIPLAIAGLVLAGCAPSVSGSAYSRGQVREAQQVYYGTVESVRIVNIEGTRTGVGTLTGAALGGIAGSAIGGGGRGTAAATIGGAVLGGIAGSAVEQGVTQQTGLEIVVRLDDGRVMAVTQAADEPFNPGERVRLLMAFDGTARVTH